MANPDEFLRDDQKKARDKAKNTNVTNAFHDRGSMIDKNMSRSQDFEAKQETQKKQNSIVQSDEKLKASKAKSNQQSNTLNQQLSKAQTAKEATKTQSATQTEQEKKSKSM